MLWFDEFSLTVTVLFVGKEATVVSKNPRRKICMHQSKSSNSIRTRTNSTKTNVRSNSCLKAKKKYLIIELNLININISLWIRVQFNTIISIMIRKGVMDYQFPVLVTPSKKWTWTSWRKEGPTLLTIPQWSKN